MDFLFSSMDVSFYPFNHYQVRNDFETLNPPGLFLKYDSNSPKGFEISCGQTNRNLVLYLIMEKFALSLEMCKFLKIRNFDEIHLFTAMCVYKNYFI